MLYFHIPMFFLFQIAAHLLFKWGSATPGCYWWGFILGNIVGASSIIFMLGMFRALPAASVLAIGTGGAFVLNQLFMFLVFRERISLPAMLGLLLIVSGVLVVAFGNHTLAQAQTKAPAAAEKQ